MKRFQFSLDSVLQLRRQELEQAALEVGRANQRLQDIQRQLQKLEQASRAAAAELRSAGEWHTAYSAVKALEEQEAPIRLLEQEQLARLAQVQAEAARRAVAVNSLETLRERRLAEHRSACQKEEQQNLDDRVMRTWSRSRPAPNSERL